MLHPSLYLHRKKPEGYTQTETQTTNAEFHIHTTMESGEALFLYTTNTTANMHAGATLGRNDRQIYAWVYVSQTDDWTNNSDLLINHSVFSKMPTQASWM